MDLAREATCGDPGARTAVEPVPAVQRPVPTAPVWTGRPLARGPRLPWGGAREFPVVCLGLLALSLFRLG